MPGSTPNPGSAQAAPGAAALRGHPEQQRSARNRPLNGPAAEKPSSGSGIRRTGPKMRFMSVAASQRISPPSVGTVTSLGSSHACPLLVSPPRWRSPPSCPLRPRRPSSPPRPNHVRSLRGGGSGLPPGPPQCVADLLWKRARPPTCPRPAAVPTVHWKRAAPPPPPRPRPRPQPCGRPARTAPPARPPPFSRRAPRPEVAAVPFPSPLRLGGGPAPVLLLSPVLLPLPPSLTVGSGCGISPPPPKVSAAPRRHFLLATAPESWAGPLLPRYHRDGYGGQPLPRTATAPRFAHGSRRTSSDTSSSPKLSSARTLPHNWALGGKPAAFHCLP